MSYVLLGCRCLLALVFLISVAGRLRGRKPYGEFVATARRLAPDWLASRMSVAVPAGLIACELAVPVLLTMPGTTVPGFALAGVLTSGYALAIGVTLRPPAGVPAARAAAGHLFPEMAPGVGGPEVLRLGPELLRLELLRLELLRAGLLRPELPASEILTVVRSAGMSPDTGGHSGGRTGYELHRGHVIRNVLLSGVAGLGMLAGLTAAGPVDLGTAVGVVIASGIVAMLIVAADRVVALLRPLT